MSKTSKKRKNKYNKENIYLFVQITVSLIFVVSALILKSNDSNAYYTVKDNYKIFFTTETTEDSNFSYNTFFNNLSDKLNEKYEILTQTFSYLYGKGKNEIYPSNISFKKFIPEEKGTMPVTGIITSKFGLRKDPFDKKSKDFHTGLDIAAPKGTFIKSAFSGKVTETGYNNVSGNYIKMENDDNIQTFYGHTQFIFVKENDVILEGQVIATVGDTGMVTGPHLHFEVLYEGLRVNPIYSVE